MKNFKAHHYDIIENFCNTFKKDAYKSIWGIDLNCNVKSKEKVWLQYQLLKYQDLSNVICVSGSTVINPSFVITQYTSCSGCAKFPELFKFNPWLFAPPSSVCNNNCCTNVTTSAGSVIKTFNFTCVSSASGISGQPIAGNTTFIYTPLVGYNIQLSLSGYGILNPGPEGTIQYTYDKSSGTITLLTGLLFDLGGVYTIFAYT